ncbi:hypothetical protein RFI_03800, partial [Reticulomyxa filosa]
ETENNALLPRLSIKRNGNERRVEEKEYNVQNKKTSREPPSTLPRRVRPLPPPPPHSSHKKGGTHFHPHQRKAYLSKLYTTQTDYRIFDGIRKEVLYKYYPWRPIWSSFIACFLYVVSFFLFQVLYCLFCVCILEWQASKFDPIWKVSNEVNITGLNECVRYDKYNNDIQLSTYPNILYVPFPLRINYQLTSDVLSNSTELNKYTKYNGFLPPASGFGQLNWYDVDSSNSSDSSRFGLTLLLASTLFLFVYQPLYIFVTTFATMWNFSVRNRNAHLTFYDCLQCFKEDCCQCYSCFEYACFIIKRKNYYLNKTTKAEKRQQAKQKQTAIQIHASIMKYICSFLLLKYVTFDKYSNFVTPTHTKIVEIY